MVMAETDLSAVLAMATQRRDEARREMEAWDDWIRRLKMLGGSAIPSGPMPDLSDYVTNDAARAPRQSANGGQKRTEPAVAATVEATKAFLEALGRPAGISEIYNEMLRRNVPVGGKVPKRTLDARLRYSGEFKGVPGKGWWLRDRPLPQDDVVPAGNTPEASSVSNGDNLKGVGF